MKNVQWLHLLRMPQKKVVDVATLIESRWKEVLDTYVASGGKHVDLLAEVDVRIGERSVHLLLSTGDWEVNILSDALASVIPAKWKVRLPYFG